MLLDPMGGIVLTNDGNAILREIDVQHPAAKSMIELARAQDEEVGDGTTSVIILAGEVLSAVEGFLEKEIHPTVIVNAYFRALDEIVKITNEIGVSILPPLLTFDLETYQSREQRRSQQDCQLHNRNQVLQQVGQPDCRPRCQGCQNRVQKGCTGQR